MYHFQYTLNSIKYKNHMKNYPDKKVFFYNFFSKVNE